MTSDPNGWFLTSQALDHHGTVDALDEAMPAAYRTTVEYPDKRAVADELAASLARLGYALVRLDDRAEVTQDLTAQVDAFLARKED